MHAEDISQLITAFRGWMAHESVRQALDRRAYPADPGIALRVENEMPFVRRVGDEIQEGFIDRLVLLERDGRVVAAEILDFKTDRVEAGDETTLRERTEHYRPQIEEYCRVVVGIYGLAERDVRGTLVSLAAGVVRDVVGEPREAAT